MHERCTRQTSTLFMKESGRESETIDECVNYHTRTGEALVNISRPEPIVNEYDYKVAYTKSGEVPFNQVVHLVLYLSE